MAIILNLLVENRHLIENYHENWYNNDDQTQTHRRVCNKNNIYFFDFKNTEKMFNDENNIGLLYY